MIFMFFSSQIVKERWKQECNKRAVRKNISRVRAVGICFFRTLGSSRRALCQFWGVPGNPFIFVIYLVKTFWPRIARPCLVPKRTHGFPFASKMGWFGYCGFRILIVCDQRLHFSPNVDFMLGAPGFWKTVESCNVHKYQRFSQTFRFVLLLSSHFESFWSHLFLDIGWFQNRGPRWTQVRSCRVKSEK